MVVKAAREVGMSYGKYVALMHEQGRDPIARSIAPEFEEEPEERLCVICGQPILRIKNGKTLTCSPACRYELNRIRNRDRYRKVASARTMETKKCQFCGTEFSTSRKYQRFCNVRCQEAYRRAVKRGEVANDGMSPGMANRSYGIGECVICGEDFTKRSARHITCCAGCRKEYWARQRKEKKC